jgi:hypothetical protein
MERPSQAFRDLVLFFRVSRRLALDEVRASEGRRVPHEYAK